MTTENNTALAVNPDDVIQSLFDELVQSGALEDVLRATDPEPHALTAEELLEIACDPKINAICASLDPGVQMLLKDLFETAVSEKEYLAYLEDINRRFVQKLGFEKALPLFMECCREYAAEHPEETRANVGPRSEAAYNEVLAEWRKQTAASPDDTQPAPAVTGDQADVIVGDEQG